MDNLKTFEEWGFLNNKKNKQENKPLDNHNVKKCLYCNKPLKNNREYEYFCDNYCLDSHQAFSYGEILSSDEARKKHIV